MESRWAKGAADDKADCGDLVSSQGWDAHVGEFEQVLGEVAVAGLMLACSQVDDLKLLEQFA